MLKYNTTIYERKISSFTTDASINSLVKLFLKTWYLMKGFVIAPTSFKHTLLVLQENPHKSSYL